MTFLNPEARVFYRDWERVARSRVAHLRAAAGADLDDPRLIELVGELSSSARTSGSCGRAMTSSASPVSPGASITARSAI
ncbi:hypothetical protein ACFQX6_41530 [Streptosporangium lutulentum]